MKISLDTKEKKITVIQWLKQGYIETSDLKDMHTVYEVHICRSKHDIENTSNPDYWEKKKN